MLTALPVIIATIEPEPTENRAESPHGLLSFGNTA